MAATVWKGHLTFGLVSIPIRLYRAARREKISFHQLYRPTPVETRPEPRPEWIGPEEPEPAAAPVARVQQGAFTGEDRTLIARSDVLKGYEYEKDRYVVIAKEDIGGEGGASGKDATGQPHPGGHALRAAERRVCAQSRRLRAAAGDEKRGVMETMGSRLCFRMGRGL